MGEDELVREADLVVAEQLRRLVGKVGLVAGMDARTPLAAGRLQEDERGPASADGQQHARRLRTGPPRHRHHGRPARAVADRVGKPMAVAAPGTEEGEVPTLAFRGVVERGGEVEHLEPHRIGGERRRRMSGQQPADLRHERSHLLERDFPRRVVCRPEQVDAEGGLGHLELAEQELLEGPPRGDLAPESAAALDPPGPVLLLAAREVADDERPAQRLEGGVALFARPVEDVKGLPRRGQPVARAARVRPLVADDAALRPALAEAVVPVDEVIAPHPGLDALLGQVLLDPQDVLRVQLARVLAAAARAERSRPPLVVSDVDAVGLEHVEVLVHHVEQDPVRLRVRGTVGVRPGHVRILGHVPPRAGDVVRVRERLDLGNDLEAVLLRGRGQAPHVVLLDVAAAAHAHVKGGRESMGGPQGDALAQLVHRLPVRVPLRGRAPPAGADLGMGIEAHRPSHLEDHAVELVAQQEVAEVALGEGELVLPGKIEMDPADGQERPVANGRLPNGQALLAPLVDELREGRDAVERAAIVAPGHDRTAVADVKAVAFLVGGYGRGGRQGGQGRRDERARDLAHEDRRSAGGSLAEDDRNRDAEVIGEERGQEPGRVLRARVARGRDDDGVAEEQAVVGVARLLREGPDRKRGRARVAHAAFGRPGHGDGGRREQGQDDERRAPHGWISNAVSWVSDFPDTRSIASILAT